MITFEALMPENTIALLPEHVANQIAAGEVVQRPASVVKELLENAIDAGATHIRLLLKDAGKTLIQVIDNGKGMNPFDARMCFERHATSKISKTEDLFQLHTKGFRGEALASIAAIAQVELKTRHANDSLAQLVSIDGGKFIGQSECQAPLGTSFTVKNLFFNVPARRNFLKSDTVEQKHIIDEVERVAIPHANIHFTITSNGNEILNLPPGNLMQRLKSLLGSYIQKELVPIDETTSFVKVQGYVCLPNAATRSKREQYFFVNNRFVRNPFLNHAIYEAYKELISFQSHPKYFIFLELDPKDIDINIHPTKTEVKFTDDKTVYMLLVSSIKRALGKANAGPTLDFENEMSMDLPLKPGPNAFAAPSVNVNPNYNPFHSQTPQDSPLQKVNRQHWESMFEGFKQEVDTLPSPNQSAMEHLRQESLDFKVFQLNLKYLVTAYNGQVVIIDQQRAHERILYEHFLNAKPDTPIATQQLLFPEQLELSANDFQLVKSLLGEFKQLGFDVEVFGKNAIVVNGTPSDLEESNVKHLLEGILENFKLNTIDSKIEKRDNLCRAIARNSCIKYGKALESGEMKQLLNHLYACENPLYTAGGKVIMMELEAGEIEKFFKR
ncbi:MAG: DNA mismatch repair endonuclease MutL [Bacteroidia bacterium]|nr:DNA mismatch repair endonuclease MutL [Bacteroidia bacterium]